MPTAAETEELMSDKAIWFDHAGQTMWLGAAEVAYVDMNEPAAELTIIFRGNSVPLTLKFSSHWGDARKVYDSIHSQLTRTVKAGSASARPSRPEAVQANRDLLP